MLNESLRMFSSLKVIPAYQSFQIIGTTVAGGVIMNEFTSYSAPQLALNFLGSIVCILGLTWQRIIPSKSSVRAKKWATSDCFKTKDKSKLRLLSEHLLDS